MIVHFNHEQSEIKCIKMRKIMQLFDSLIQLRMLAVQHGETTRAFVTISQARLTLANLQMFDHNAQNVTETHGLHVDLCLLCSALEKSIMHSFLAMSAATGSDKSD
jgi:hypothetical protein